MTLVDIRAWDTMGEISVLLVAATGIASLVFLSRRAGAIYRADGPASRPRRVGWDADPMAALRRPGGDSAAVDAGGMVADRDESRCRRARARPRVAAGRRDARARSGGR